MHFPPVCSFVTPLQLVVRWLLWHAVRRVSKGFVIGYFFFVLKALQNIIASFCSRFPLTFLRSPPTRPFNSFSNRRELGIAESVRRILLEDYLVSARELSSLVSKIISAGVVFGDISRFTTRYCYVSVESSQDWDSKFIWINTVLGNLIFGEKIRHD